MRRLARLDAQTGAGQMVEGAASIGNCDGGHKRRQSDTGGTVTFGCRLIRELIGLIEIGTVAVPVTVPMPMRTARVGGHHLRRFSRAGMLPHHMQMHRQPADICQHGSESDRNGGTDSWHDA